MPLPCPRSKTEPFIDTDVYKVLLQFWLNKNQQKKTDSSFKNTEKFDQTQEFKTANI